MSILEFVMGIRRGFGPNVLNISLESEVGVGTPPEVGVELTGSIVFFESQATPPLQYMTLSKNGVGTVFSGVTVDEVNNGYDFTWNPETRRYEFVWTIYHITFYSDGTCVYAAGSYSYTARWLYGKPGEVKLPVTYEPVYLSRENSKGRYTVTCTDGTGDGWGSVFLNIGTQQFQTSVSSTSEDILPATLKKLDTGVLHQITLTTSDGSTISKKDSSDIGFSITENVTGKEIEIVNMASGSFPSNVKSGTAWGPSFYVVENDNKLPVIVVMGTDKSPTILSPDQTVVFVDSGGKEGLHDNAESFTHTFIAPEGKNLTVSGTYSIENNWDFLRIYEGETADGKKVAELTGLYLKWSYGGSSNALTFVWESDNAVVSDGWEFRIRYK